MSKPTKDTNTHPTRAIRRAGVPLCGIETPDPGATIEAIRGALNGKQDEIVIIQHDIVRGLRGVNKSGADWLKQDEALSNPMATLNPTECLSVLADKIPQKAIAFMLGAHREIEDGAGFNPGVCQALWNCRTAFEAQGATLVLLAPALRLPPELSRDVVIVTEALPDFAMLASILDSICEDAKSASEAFKMPTAEERPVLIDTLLGLSAFEARQACALSVTREGMDPATLWSRKVKAIEATPGLTVYRGKETIDDIGGLANAKAQFSATIRGKGRISCIVFVDEIDKGMAAAGTDSSGTTQDQLKALLSYMQDNDIIGASELGPPGTGKTQLAKALANTFRCPLIMVDLGAMKGGLVGQSEQNMRAALRVIHAISDGRALFIGACNRSDNLPPELRRRFSYLNMFFDLPDAEERETIWKVHTNRLRFRGELVTLEPKQLDREKINDTGWTGAEIRNCCLKAYMQDIPLSEAARSIIPVSKSAKDQIEALRVAASGKYVSAAINGPYVYDGGNTTTTNTTAPSRKMSL